MTHESGRLTIKRDVKRMQTALLSTALASGLFAVQATNVLAEDVTLKTKDGTSQISGEILGYDGHSYILKSQLGQMKVQASLFDCIGDTCPDLNRLDKGFAILSNYDRVGDLMFALSTNISQEERSNLDNQISGRDGTLAFSRSDADVAIDVTSSSSDAAFDQLISGQAGMIIVNRAPTEDELARAKAAGLGNLNAPSQRKAVAQEGVSVVVGRNVGLRSLSYFDLQDIFGGNIDDWADFGLRAAPVAIYGTADTEGANETFRDKVMAGTEFGANVTLLPTSADVLAALENDPNAIGFLNHTVAGNARMTELAIEDQCGRLTAPTDFNIKMGQYPLSNVIYAIAPEQPVSKLANALHATMTLKEGQQFLGAFGLLDNILARYPIDSQGRRMIQTVLPTEVDMTLDDAQSFFRELEFADRLSMNLSFTTGTEDLDAESQKQLEELSQMLKRGEFDGKDVVFVGFTDSIGRPDLNKAESEQRAERVLTAFEGMIPTEAYRNYAVTSVGFGELSPLYCNDEPQGRAGNRRVEIWVREQY